MIVIDYKKTLDNEKIIIISNKADSKNKNNIEINLSNPENWNKEKINDFLIRTVSLAENKLDKPILTEEAQLQVENSNEQILFIYNLFVEFVEKYNDSL